jgi:hypothetical protein
VKYTLVRGLALSFGVCAISNAAIAQLSIGGSGPGVKSGASAPVSQPIALMMGSGAEVSKANPQAVGSGVAASQASPSTASPPQYMVAGRTEIPEVEITLPANLNTTVEGVETTVAASVSSAQACTTSTCGTAIQPLNPWIFGANGLLLNRLDNDCTALTYNRNDPTYPLLCTELVDMPRTGGFEVMGGRYFGCGRYAVIGSYWGVFSELQHATANASPGVVLTSALPFTYQAPLGGPDTGIRMVSQYVSDWYDSANVHRVTREQSFQNAEVNFVSFALGGGARQPYGPGSSTCLFGGGAAGDCRPGTTGPCAPWYGAQCSPLRLNTFAGLRWFQFRDQFEFGASEADAVFDYSSDDMFYRNEVTNDLWGGQLGATATYCTGRWVNLFAGTSFGVYNNRMSLSSYAGTANEIATVVSTNAFNGQQYSFTAHDNTVAVLGEGNVGAGLRISRGWSANVGYRLVGVSGVATSVGQIPREFGNLDDAWKLRSNQGILLHGLTVGATYNF